MCHLAERHVDNLVGILRTENTLAPLEPLSVDFPFSRDGDEATLFGSTGTAIGGASTS